MSELEADKKDDEPREWTIPGHEAVLKLAAHLDERQKRGCREALEALSGKPIREGMKTLRRLALLLAADIEHCLARVSPDRYLQGAGRVGAIWEEPRAVKMLAFRSTLAMTHQGHSGPGQLIEKMSGEIGEAQARLRVALQRAWYDAVVDEADLRLQVLYRICLQAGDAPEGKIAAGDSQEASRWLAECSRDAVEAFFSALDIARLQDWLGRKVDAAGFRRDVANGQMDIHRLTLRLTKQCNSRL